MSAAAPPPRRSAGAASGSRRGAPGKLADTRSWWRRLPGIILGVAIVLAVVAVGFHRSLLEWSAARLCVEDPLRKADAIVVLAGERGERVREGVALLRQGWAPRLLMSGGPSEADVPLADIMRDQALREGVPAAAILVQERSVDTGEDARFSLEMARAHGWKRVILVTSPYHARRAAWLFHEVFAPAGIEVLNNPVRQSWFSPKGWWTRKSDCKVVLMEYMKSAWYAVSWLAR